ncbi:MAG: ATP-dependent DNA ligase [Thermoplasmata archaeon]|nr:ATP-dependent DNA ligase [Thermoplasmata archaeon]
MNFLELANLFEKIEKTTKRLEITDLLSALLRKLSPDEIDKVCYLILGRLSPDFTGTELGVADALVLRTLSLTAGIKQQVVEEIMKKTGDIGECAEEVIKQKKQVSLFRETLTVEKVYGTLWRIAESTGAGSQDLKLKLIAELFHDAEPLEARYIARILAGSLRLGVADSTILDALAVAFAPDMEKEAAREVLEEKYNLCSDIGHVAKTIASGGIKALDRIGLKIGVPIRAMLAERVASIEEIFERHGERFAAEYKYDGLRIQAHIGPNGEMKLFSRRMENLTAQFPDVIENLKLSFKGKDGIFEGECVPVDLATEEMLPFQEISRRRGRKHGIVETMEEIPVCLFLFDCLYLDGREYIKEDYLVRRNALTSAFRPTERIKFSVMDIVASKERCEEFFNEAIGAGCEGIMAKSIAKESIYRPGKRGFLWLKYKREYKSELTDTLDLVVLGAFAGRGRRAGTYGALLTGVYNQKTEKFETVCKLGTGFDDATLARLHEVFSKFVAKARPENVFSRIEPDFWFYPAIVLEVRGAELTLSPVHTCAYNEVRRGAGIAVRFPRFTGRWRDDKIPTDATTTAEIVEMYRKQLKKVED